MRTTNEPRLRSHRGLVALCVLLPSAEAIVLAAVGLRGALPFAPQVTAPAPYGLFHDLRFLYVYHPSWWAFALEAPALLAWRTLLDALIVRLAWPRDVPRPSRLIRPGYTLVAALLLTPSAAVTAGMGVAPVSYLLFGALPIVVLIAALTPHGPVTSWWRTPPPWRAAAWSLLAFVVATAAGTVLAVVPVWAAAPVAALAGWFDAWAWLGAVRATANRRARRPLPLAPAGIAALALVVVLGITLTLQLRTVRTQSQRPPAPRGGRPVLIVSGYGTPWRGDPPPALGPGLSVERFSYRGLDRHQEPLPYPGSDTHRSLEETVELVDRQVDALAQRSGRPVSIVASSEGALAAAAYVAGHPGGQVDHLVLLSPLIAPGRTYVSPPGQEGWGVATGAVLRGLGRTLAATTPLRVRVEGPFLRSVGEHAPTLGRLLTCPPPGVATVALLPLADAVAAPYSARIGLPVGVVPGFHGDLFDQAGVRRVIATFLANGQVSARPWQAAAERAIRAAAGTWQSPALRPSLVPAWRGQPTKGCTDLAQALR